MCDSAKVAEVLRSEIEIGKFRSGSLLPSVDDLRRRFGLGEFAIRKALAILRKDGLVDIRQHVGTVVVGKGAFKWNGRVAFVTVSSRDAYYENSLAFSFSKAMEAQGWAVQHIAIASDVDEKIDLSPLKLTATATDNTSGLRVIEDAHARLISGHIVATNFHLRPTKNNISALGYPTFVVDGAEASVRASARIGVDQRGASLIVSNGLWSGAFYVGEYNARCSNCLLRVTGPNSRFETPLDSRSVLGYGGAMNRVEVLDGAVLCLPGVHSSANLDLGDESWSGKGSGDGNVLRVDHATLAVTNGSIRTYRSASNRIEIVNGSTACVNSICIGAANHFSDRGLVNTRGNVLDVAGSGTRVTIRTSLCAGSARSQENLVEVRDGACVYATNSARQVYIGYQATAPSNTLRICSGGFFRMWGLIIGYLSDGNALELENGTCLVDASVAGAGLPPLTMSSNDAALGDNRVVFKGTNSYLYARYAVLRGRLRYEIPAAGLVAAKKTQAVFSVGHLKSMSAAIAVDVDGACPRGKWLLFCWSGQPSDLSYTADDFIANTTLTGDGASRARLVGDDKKVYLKVHGNGGMAVIVR